MACTHPQLCTLQLPVRAVKPSPQLLAGLLTALRCAQIAYAPALLPVRTCDVASHDHVVRGAPELVPVLLLPPAHPRHAAQGDPVCCDEVVMHLRPWAAGALEGQRCWQGLRGVCEQLAGAPTSDFWAHCSEAGALCCCVARCSTLPGNLTACLGAAAGAIAGCCPSYVHLLQLLPHRVVTLKAVVHPRRICTAGYSDGGARADAGLLQHRPADGTSALSCNGVGESMGMLFGYRHRLQAASCPGAYLLLLPNSTAAQAPPCLGGVSRPCHQDNISKNI